MIDLFREYLSFTNRPFDETTVTGVQIFPQFYTTMLLLTAGFSLLYKIVPILLDTFLPAWYNELEPVKRKELPTYLISFVHHFVVVPLGWYHIYQDYTMWRSNMQPPTDFYALDETPLIAFGCAFLLADIINCALAEALSGKPLYLCHHILIITFGEYRQHFRSLYTDDCTNAYSYAIAMSIKLICP